MKGLFSIRFPQLGPRSEPGSSGCGNKIHDPDDRQGQGVEYPGVEVLGVVEKEAGLVKAFTDQRKVYFDIRILVGNVGIYMMQQRYVGCGKDVG